MTGRVTVVVARGRSGRSAAPAALAALAEGSIVAIPTDTVYGLAARVDRPGALAGIFAAKGRPPGLALPVLVGRTRQVREVAAEWPRSASHLSARFWPGALTLVVPALPGIGPLLGGTGETVGVRRPAHAFVRALCTAAGPLAVTSANRHGEPPCTSAAAVVAAFGAPGLSDTPGVPDTSGVPGTSGAPGAHVPHGPADGALGLVVDGGLCDREPSTVVDCTADVPVCLREGAIPWSWVEAALR